MSRTIKTLLLLGISSFAFAQEPPAFEEVDKNSDGQISREEAATIEGLDFASADKDQSGSLSREEYVASQAE